MSRFLSHLGTSAIMDLLLQLVAVPEGEQTRLGLAVVRWVEMAGVEFAGVEVAEVEAAAVEVAAVEGAGVHGVMVR